MAADNKKNRRKGAGGATLARQITIVIFAVIICVTIVLLAVSLDLVLNPSKSWTDSLAVRWISERRNLLPFFR